MSDICLRCGKFAPEDDRLGGPGQPYTLHVECGVLSLAEARSEFEAAGGRGVELADEIDWLEKAINAWAAPLHASISEAKEKLAALNGALADLVELGYLPKQPIGDLPDMTIDGHRFVHVAACPCDRIQAEVQRLKDQRQVEA